VNVTHELDVVSPDRLGRPVRPGDLYRPITERRAQPPMASEQPEEAPSPSGLFRDVMGVFGGVGFPVHCRPAVDEDDEDDDASDDDISS
jgi:hypothetical protein